MTPDTPREQQRHFMLGVIYGAWFLARMHHETALAEMLLDETGVPVTTLRRLAHREEYHFPRGFWADVQQRRTR